MARTFLVLILLLLVLQFTKASDFDGIPEAKATFHHSSIGEKFFWTTKCFNNVTAQLIEYSATGVTIKLHISGKSSSLCNDLYVFATPHGFHVHQYVLPGTHNVHFKWKTREEYEECVTVGVIAFLVQDGVLKTIQDAYQIKQFFTGGEENNLEFLKHHMNLTLDKRDIQEVPLEEEDIQSGDFFAVLNVFRGEAVVMYGTGGIADHAAVALRIDGQMYVVESCSFEVTHGISGVIRTPWKKWYADYKRMGSMITLLRLSPERRAMFDEEKAAAFFKKAEGSPYGFHNFIFAWLDTAKDNYPQPFSAETMVSFFYILSAFKPQDFTRFAGEALSHRLGLPQLNSTLAQITKELARRNMSFADALAMPEQDAWMYSDGYSMVCSVFVTRLYKEAGIFGKLDVQAAEFTPKDVYQMDIWDTTMPKAIKKCTQDGNDNPHCQILGSYKLPLKDASSVKLYDRMNQRCGALPPAYIRFPADC